MAHEGKKFTTARKVPHDGLWDNHSLEGTTLNQSDLLLHDGEYWIAVQEGDDFHLRRATGTLEHGYFFRAEEAYGVVFRPIHPDMKFEDIEGATHAYDDGTHWLFAHCSPGEQIDYAADVRTFAVDQFTIAIAKAQVKVDESTNAVVRARAIEKVKAITKFAEVVGVECYNTIVGATLGYYHKDRHNDHRRDIVIAAIDKITAAWQAEAATDKAVRTEITNALAASSDVKSSLSLIHNIKWRHVAEKEAAAAKKKAEEAAAAEQETSGTESQDTSNQDDNS